MEGGSVPDDQKVIIRVAGSQFFQESEGMATVDIVPSHNMEIVSFNGIDGAEEVAVGKFLLIGNAKTSSNFPPASPLIAHEPITHLVQEQEFEGF